MARETITIVGAGLAGALLAVLLRKRGYPVDIFERRPDLRRAAIPGGRSINLALAERGLHGLRMAGLEQAVMAEAVKMRGRMVHDRDGHQNLQPYGVSDDEVIWSVHRGRLNRTLLDAAEAAGARLRFNARLDSADIGLGLLQFVDETDESSFEIHATRIIGADGAGSALRTAMAAQHDLGERFAPLGHGYKEIHVAPAADGGWRFDPDALHIWPRGGHMMIALPNSDRSFTCTLFLPNKANQVAAKGGDTNSPSSACGGGMGRGQVSTNPPSHPQAEPDRETTGDTNSPSSASGGGMGRGPVSSDLPAHPHSEPKKDPTGATNAPSSACGGGMVRGPVSTNPPAHPYAEPDSETTGDTNSPSSAGEQAPAAFDRLDSDAAVQALFERDFADLIAHTPNYLQQFRDNPTGLLGTLYLDRWYHADRALLIGDAAHAIVPFHGQGMNCAFEDCAALVQALDAAGDSPDWSSLFANFQALRKPNADAIAQMALENYVEMRDAVADPRYQLRRALEQALARRQPGSFLPRYTMVMFTRIPYATALARGEQQRQVLEEAIAGHDHLDSIDMAALQRRVAALPQGT